MTEYRWAKGMFLDRAKRAVQHIPVNVTSVLDIGCGHQDLRGLLAPNVKYVGVDKVGLVPSTIICDVDAGVIPFTEPFDLTVCLGLFEYLPDPLVVLQQIKKISPLLLVSFAPVYSQTPRDIEAFGDLLTQAGWVGRTVDVLDDPQFIFLCRRQEGV